MKRHAFLLFALVPGVTLSQVPVENCQITLRAPNQLAFTFTNDGPAPTEIAIPAGLICAGADAAARMLVLQSATATVPAQGTCTVLVPAVWLSQKGHGPAGAWRRTREAEPRLDRLLKRLAGQPDFPRATAQLATLCLLEDVTFAQWQIFLAAHEPAATHPTPAEVVQAIDVLGLLRDFAPERTFALTSDRELKLRALRNPWCRAKAMQLYGLDVGDAREAGLPSLGQLLHTKAGDNCPVCRSRAEMQKGVDGF